MLCKQQKWNWNSCAMICQYVYWSFLLNYHNSAKNLKLFHKGKFVLQNGQVDGMQFNGIVPAWSGTMSSSPGFFFFFKECQVFGRFKNIKIILSQYHRKHVSEQLQTLKRFMELQCFMTTEINQFNFLILQIRKQNPTDFCVVRYC